MSAPQRGWYVVEKDGRSTAAAGTWSMAWQVWLAVQKEIIKITVTLTEVLRNFSDYINRVAYRGEGFILLRGGRPVAELTPVPSGTQLGDLPDLLASLPRLTEEEAEAFAGDLERARDEHPEHEPRSPWES